MEKEKMIAKAKVIIGIVIVVLLLWVVLLKPYIEFKSNENKALEAAKRYYEINRTQLPTGKRVATVTLQDLYSKAFLKNDLYAPLGKKKPCSPTKSWVKVKHENGKYKYYTYLKCGVLSSTIDHKGPEITLNGKDVVVVNVGNKYKELGVKSVNDNTDGSINVNNVDIDSKAVNTKKIGDYEVVYTAVDSFGNKTEKIRTVKVVSKLKEIIKKDTNKLGYYKGINPNNYVYLSGMLFRIVGINKGNIKLIAEQDVSVMNYDGIDKWLNSYYYDHLTKKAKGYIVKTKYCNMKLTEENKNTTKCSSYTDKKNVYMISADEINKSIDDEDSFLMTDSVSWTANKFDNKESYATRNIFYGVNENSVMKLNKNFNYGIRPVITIKGSVLVKSGKGTSKSPYSIGDFKYGKSDTYLNTRYTGEYIKYSGYLWRIIEIKDGYTRIICDDTLKSGRIDAEVYDKSSNGVALYNTNKKSSVGYYIKNKTNEFVKQNYFANRNIIVPIYKKTIKYGKEIDKKTYSTKLSAPNMYEMFSAYDYSARTMGSYWFINSSKEKGIKSAMVGDGIGVPINEKLDDYSSFGIRPVGYINKSVKIVNGKGLRNNPYIISD